MWWTALVTMTWLTPSDRSTSQVYQLTMTRSQFSAIHGNLYGMLFMKGSLPIKVSNDLPESLVVREFNPTPPLPPRGADDEQLPSPLPARTLI